MSKNASQSGPLDKNLVKEQISELRKKGEKEKIHLSSEIEEYIRSNLRKIQNLLLGKQPIYRKDLEFVEKIRTWMSLPKSLREKYLSVEAMEGSDEFKEVHERQISLQQWIDLLMIARLKAKKGIEKKWIDEHFNFPGDRIVEATGDLRLTRDLAEKVQLDAVKLKKEGKVKRVDYFWDFLKK